jgi:hypothetical protein
LTHMLGVCARISDVTTSISNIFVIFVSPAWKILRIVWLGGNILSHSFKPITHQPTFQRYLV